MYTLTDEQQAVISHVASGKSLMVKALAGSAKTTTLVHAAQALPHRDILALAFNAKIKEELEAKLPPGCTTKTLNGLGHGAWAKYTNRKLFVDTKKMNELIRVKDLPWEMNNVIAHAKLNGLVPNGTPGKGFTADTEETWAFFMHSEEIEPNPFLIMTCRKVLQESIQEAFKGHIDFNDQIYMPICFGGFWPTPATVLVDEAQDLSPLNHEMLKKCAKKQLVVVGDPHQAIYAWRGADCNSMETLKNHFDLEEKHLTICFRCSKEVVKTAQRYAPEMQPFSGAKDGHVEFLKQWNLQDLPSKITFICRNNAPLIKCALRVALQGKRVTFIGDQRVKVKLTNLLKKVGHAHDSIEVLRAKLAEWYEDKMANEKLPNRIREMYHDNFTALIYVFEMSTSYTDVIRNIDLLFAYKNADYIFSTGHGSKGLEWPTVCFLEPGLIPSNFAVTPEQLQQEENLAYVITTRSQDKLFYITNGGMI